MTRLYEARNHVLIHAGYENPVLHRHMAAHILISPDGPIQVASDSTEFLCHGAVIPSGLSHRVDTFGKEVLVFLYDCTTGTAKQIRQFHSIPEESCHAVMDFYAILQQDCSPENYRHFESSVLKCLGFEAAAAQVQDARIREAMAYIHSRASEKLTCKEVSDTVCLSQGRFSHLFKEQVGMTFAAFLIYQRIVSVYTWVLQGKSVTAAALDAGFSSSSHFADVNCRVFGTSIRSITRDLTLIKVT